MLARLDANSAAELDYDTRNTQLLKYQIDDDVRAAEYMSSVPHDTRSIEKAAELLIDSGALPLLLSLSVINAQSVAELLQLFMNKFVAAEAMQWTREDSGQLLTNLPHVESTSHYLEQFTRSYHQLREVVDDVQREVDTGKSLELILSQNTLHFSEYWMECVSYKSSVRDLHKQFLIAVLPLAVVDLRLLARCISIWGATSVSYIAAFRMSQPVKQEPIEITHSLPSLVASLHDLLS